MRARITRRFLVLIVAGIVPGRAPAQDARALFLQHCASCHGESGDGQGTATLDRPARSFKDGGFSYGNTSEALTRTITHGIPGTPMPAAPSVLSEAERKALAEYVLSLGPPVVTATVAESLLAVRDRPVILRGKLPPVGPDLPERPRGLLIGTVDGLSFEYRTDDVRLLAVRQGAFADRRDWRGRGGDALLPLGVPIHLSGRGDPLAPFARPDGSALAARLAGTFIEGARAGLRYRLFGEDASNSVASVEESVRGCTSGAGSGFARDFSIEGKGRFVLRAAEPGPAWVASSFTWTVRRREDGSFEALSVRGLRRGEMLSVAGGAVLVPLDLDPEGKRSLEIQVLLLPRWSPEIEERWLSEVKP
jgi:mono/diheme cytochrome c family protein